MTPDEVIVLFNVTMQDEGFSQHPIKPQIHPPTSGTSFIVIHHFQTLNLPLPSLTRVSCVPELSRLTGIRTEPWEQQIPIGRQSWYAIWRISKVWLEKRRRPDRFRSLWYLCSFRSSVEKRRGKSFFDSLSLVVAFLFCSEFLFLWLHLFAYLHVGDICRMEMPDRSEFLQLHWASPPSYRWSMVLAVSIIVACM